VTTARTSTDVKSTSDSVMTSLATTMAPSPFSCCCSGGGLRGGSLKGSPPSTASSLATSTWALRSASRSRSSASLHSHV